VLITCLYHESKESARKRPGGAVTIVVGYIPSPQGEAALDAALAEARTHDSELVVLNVSRGEALMEPKRLYDEQAAELTRRLEESGVRYTLRREVHPEPSAENVLDVLTDPEHASYVELPRIGRRAGGRLPLPRLLRGDGR
jgi:hypothetical protein